MSEPEFIELDESDINTIDVYVEPLELYKLLKIANLVGGGGEAKMLIADGYVGVNGELCQQKRRKIYQGDLVEFNGEFMQIRLVDAPALSAQQTASNDAKAATAEPVTNPDSHATVSAKPKGRTKTKTKTNTKTKNGGTGKPTAKKKSETNTEKRSPTGRRSISF
ncbi:RNA-binding S4 domain-containing protein [Thalassotalea litorea]|uniref:RNA-binding S4 domain-containing protein n=1 Tax=Thalassotalea litorea TaxID=2020715 RepID=UPI0037350D3F